MASKLIITTGDVDGIGPEVTAKALLKMKPRKDAVFYFYRHRKQRQNFRLPKLSRVNSLGEALALNIKSGLVEISSSASPAQWVEEAAEACLRKDFDALVTAPLSKITIKEAGLKEIGHTEILARVTGARDLHMGFIGSQFAVVLATGHRSLKETVTNFNLLQLRKGLRAAEELRRALPPSRRKRPIAVVGLNPHAGEQGLIGKEEIWFKKAFSKETVGPLVPDAAFLSQNWPLYSVYVCPYHDQGLIPFKMVHGFEGGVHLTLGLPFVRTSVDHGTAKEIFGLGKAKAGSMHDALMSALRLSKGSSK